MFNLGQDIGIDLGTSSIIVYVKGKGIVFREPAIVAINERNREIVAIGREARKMIGKAPKGIRVVKPIKDGVVSDYSVAKKMMKMVLKKVNTKKIISPKVLVSIPNEISEVEKRAIIDVLEQIGARKVILIEESLASAIGSNIDIKESIGTFLVNIGGGITNIAVIALGKTYFSKSVNVAGDKFNQSIVRKIKKEFNTKISEKTAEELKINIGSIYPQLEEKQMIVKGVDTKAHIPQNITVRTSDIYSVLRQDAEEIVNNIITTFEKLTPELVSDIYKKGIILAGGGSLLKGMDRLIYEQTGINVVYSENVIDCVALGIGKVLDKLEEYNDE